VTGGAEVVVFNSVYAAARPLLEPDRILVVKGRVDHKQEGETKLIAIEVAAFEATPERREVRLCVDARCAPAGVVRELAELLRRYPGDSQVLLEMAMTSGSRRLAFGPGYRVAADSDFFTEVRELLGESALA
jgi:DNA polymerase-3 subunit alpha